MVLIIAVKLDFGLQWSITQMVFLLNTSYLFAVSPYIDVQDRIPDYFNSVVLIVLSIL